MSPTARSVPTGLTFGPYAGGIHHNSGVSCNTYDWCSNANSGGTAHFLWYGPYLNLAGSYQFHAQIYFYWTDSNGNIKSPSLNDQFTFDVTNNSGATTLAAMSQHYACTSLDSCNYDAYLYGVPIQNLEMRAYNVCPSYCNGDVLHITSTDMY